MAEMRSMWSNSARRRQGCRYLLEQLWPIKFYRNFADSQSCHHVTQNQEQHINEKQCLSKVIASEWKQSEQCLFAFDFHVATHPAGGGQILPPSRIFPIDKNGDRCRFKAFSISSWSKLRFSVKMLKNRLLLENDEKDNFRHLKKQNPKTQFLEKVTSCFTVLDHKRKCSKASKM